MDLMLHIKCLILYLTKFPHPGQVSYNWIVSRYFIAIFVVAGYFVGCPQISSKFTIYLSYIATFAQQFVFFFCQSHSLLEFDSKECYDILQMKILCGILSLNRNQKPKTIKIFKSLNLNDVQIDKVNCEKGKNSGKENSPTLTTLFEHQFHRMWENILKWMSWCCSISNDWFNLYIFRWRTQKCLRLTNDLNCIFKTSKATNQYKRNRSNIDSTWINLIIFTTM